ncbi:MAG: DUF4244 domain-containing protein [Acidimicrobiales bacterium]
MNECETEDANSRTAPAVQAARRPRESGQATAEYALVMLAAAALAGLLIAWAASTDGIGRLADAVLDSLIERTE